MSALAAAMERLGADRLERALGLRPRYPGVSLGIDSERLALVRVRARRGKATLEAMKSVPLAPGSIPAAMFQTQRIDVPALAKRFSELFAATGTKPGRVSLVMPDNLSKISLIHLPERPAGARQLEELIRTKMRRAVPFRLDEARIAWQELPSDDRSVTVLVVLVRRALIEQLEAAVEAAGARVGLIDISTPNVINLCRPRLEELGGSADVALLNGTSTYFSLAILRGPQLIFFRCKSYAAHDADADAGADAPAPAPAAAQAPTNGVLAREVANSLAYYTEKLQGSGIAAVCVRSVGAPFEEMRAKLARAGLSDVVPVEPLRAVEAGGLRVDDDELQRLAPLLGAAAGRR